MLDGPRREYPKASGLVLVRSPLLISHVWRALVSSGRMSCCLIWCYVCSVCFIFVFFVFAEDAVLRSIVLRSSICMRSDSHTQLPLSASVLFYVFLSLGILLFPSIFVPLLVPLSLCNGECVCVFSSHSFWTSSSLDIPAGVTQEEGHTGFLIHLLSVVRALIFLARRIQPFLSLVDREVEFCVLTI